MTGSSTAIATTHVANAQYHHETWMPSARPASAIVEMYSAWMASENTRHLVHGHQLAPMRQQVAQEVVVPHRRKRHARQHEREHQRRGGARRQRQQRRSRRLP